MENDTITVFDLSWNSIGGGNPSSVDILCEVLKKNQEIIHMDLSSNYFTLDECKKIQQALKSNRTIYGFHFVGNFG